MQGIVITLLVAAAIGFAVAARRFGPRYAIGSIVLDSLCVPSWLGAGAEPLRVDPQTMVALLGMVGYLLHPQGTIPRRWVLTDFAIAALVAIHVLSDTINDGFGWWLPVRACGEWAVPYVAGRWAVKTLDDVPRLATVALVVSIILALWGATEAIARINPAALLVGERPADLMDRLSIRWGIKRAEGPTMHPIYFGMLVTLLLPWTVQFASLAGQARRFRLLAPLANLVALGSAASRGPIAAVAIAAYTMAMCRWRRWRLALGAAAVILLLVLFAARDQLLETMHSWSEERYRNASVIEVDHEKVRYTGSLHRLYLHRVYRAALIKAGLIGFGTERTTGFPPRVPLEENDPAALKRLKAIDDHYILLQLRFGGLAVIAFLTVGGSATVYCLRAADQPTLDASFFAALGGVLLGTLITLLSVWLPHDIGFLFFWNCGVAASLHTAQREQALALNRRRALRAANSRDA